MNRLQKERLADLRAKKTAWITEQLETFGYAACQKCGAKYGPEYARQGLTQHHKRKSSLRGPMRDHPSNLTYWCNGFFGSKCHAVHHLTIGA